MDINFPEIRLGDPHGLYLDVGCWHYLGEPLNTIFIVGISSISEKTKIENIIQSINHEYLHHILNIILPKKEHERANYGLDYLIFVAHVLTPDLMMKEVEEGAR